MDLAVVLGLILVLISSGQSHSKAYSCHITCPPGYHLSGSCNDAAATPTCKICGDKLYMDKNNTRRACLRCDRCNSFQKEIRNCTFTSNVVCDCKDGYYNSGSDNDLDCNPCSCQHCGKPDNNPDYSRKCQPCQNKKCLEDPECKRKCANTTTTTTTATATTTTTTTLVSTTTVAGENDNQMLLLFLVVIVIVFLVLFWLLLLFIKYLHRFQDICPCWTADKDLESPAKDPKFNEQRNHQGSSPTTPSFKTFEETPKMSPSQLEHPSSISPLLPGGDHTDARQEKQSDHWPAIVLYAIIKEVPLRRWKEFLRLLSVTDQQMERVELEAGFGLGSVERQYQMLRLWSQRSSASLDDVFKALCHMDLSGCAQLLQESLENL